MTRFLCVCLAIAVVALVSGCDSMRMIDYEGNANLELSEVILPAGNDKSCKTIQSGEIENSVGEIIKSGYDQWGYNYQARLFNGKYCDSYRDAAWCQPYKDVNLSMKWNDAWVSNKDCDGDNLLDRHNGFDSYLDSGAWLTNHQSGEDEGAKWTYFVKIAAAHSDWTRFENNWYDENGVLVGPVIWGEFAILQEVESGEGATFVSPRGPGFGQF